MAVRGVKRVGADFIEFKYKLLDVASEKYAELRSVFPQLRTACKLLDLRWLNSTVKNSNPIYQQIILVQSFSWSASIPANSTPLFTNVNITFLGYGFARQS